MARGNWAPPVFAFACPVCRPALRCSPALVLAFRSAIWWGSSCGLGFQSARMERCHLLSKEVPKALCLGQGGVWLCARLGHPESVPPSLCLQLSLGHCHEDDKCILALSKMGRLPLVRGLGERGSTLVTECRESGVSPELHLCSLTPAS